MVSHPGLRHQGLLEKKSWGDIRDAFKERVTLTSGDVSDEPFAFARVAGKAQKQEEKKARIERSKLEMILECLKADFCWEADMEGLGDVVLISTASSMQRSLKSTRRRCQR